MKKQNQQNFLSRFAHSIVKVMTVPQKKSEAKARVVSGFTLIETLVAITILILSITGPLQIASNSLLSSYYARDQITAYYLASEAIEYVKNARDTRFLMDVFTPATPANNYWLQGLGKCINGGEGAGSDFKGCTVDALVPFASGSGVVACDGLCPVIQFDNDSGLWGYGNPGMVVSKFRRTVEVIPQSGDEEAVIRVKVEWPSLNLFGGDKVFVLTSYMMNWERR